MEIEATKKGLNFKRHNVPVRPASVAFKIDDAKRENEDVDRMEEIVEKMKSVVTEGWAGKSLIDKVREMKIPNDVKEQAILYLETVDNSNH